MNDDFLRKHRKKPDPAFAKQLHEQLVQREREKFARTNHTHIKENKDMNTIALPQRRDPPLDIFARHLLTAIVAVLMAAFVFILMINSPLIHSPGFLGTFQDKEEFQKDQVELYINQAWNTGDTAILADLLSDDHVTTTTIFGTVEGAEGVANLIRSYRTAMPDFTYRINQISSVGGTVWLHGTITGTHTGAFTLPDGTEIPPSGNVVTIDSVIEFTFTDERISAINQVDNTQDLMEQFGAAQTIENAAKTAQNLRAGLNTTERTYAVSRTDPPPIIPETVIMRRGYFEWHWWFGNEINSQTNPDYGYTVKIPTVLNVGWWDVFHDGQFKLVAATASEDFVVIAFQLDAEVSPQSADSILPGAYYPEGGEAHMERVAIYRRSEDGRFSEIWEYVDNEELARAGYGWPRKDE